MRTARRGAGRGGRLRALAVLGVLAVGAFGLGAVAGGLWEEPGLVLGYVFGETVRVPWGEESAAPRLAAETPPVRPAPPAPAGPARPPDVAAAPPVGPVPGRLAIQVGAFAEDGAAQGLAERLRAAGYPVYVSRGAQAGEARWRVRVGPLDSREEAEGTAGRLRAEERLPTWVLTEEGR